MPYGGSINRKRFVDAFLLALGYGICFQLLLFLLCKVQIIPFLPGYSRGLPFDVAWYDEIVRVGYKYYNGAQANSAFFPLLPWVWKLSHLGPRGMAILNTVFFSLAFALFSSMYKPDRQTSFLWLTIPSIYFVWVPYAEALFILFNTVAIYGMVHNRRWIIWVGLFLVSLTRPTTMVLAPALLIMELITNDNKSWLSSVKQFFINYAIPLFAGLTLFIVYQYYSTGVWFAFFKQELNWGHDFAWPTFPLSNYHGLKLLWLDAAAMFTGVVTLTVLLILGVKWLFKNIVETDKVFVLSCLYITGVTLITLLFNPTWGSNTTNVFDIHRYVFASPFFWIIFLRFIALRPTYKFIHFIWILVPTNLFWLLFAHYSSAQHFAYFNAAGIYIMLYMLLANKRVKWAPFVIVLINIVLQVSMYLWFFSGIYPG